MNGNLSDSPNKSLAESARELTENLLAAKEMGLEFMYQTLIDYGSKLGDFPEEEKNDENLIRGCQSTVYISGEKKGDRVFLKAFADAKLVAGQTAILVELFNGRTAKEIIEEGERVLKKFIEETNVIESLTPSRQNAFGSMYERIKQIASGE